MSYKITLYRPIVRSFKGYVFAYERWADDKSLFHENGDIIIGWQEMEVEVNH
jgi:hypothetical protein